MVQSNTTPIRSAWIHTGFQSAIQQARSPLCSLWANQTASDSLLCIFFHSKIIFVIIQSSCLVGNIQESWLCVCGGVEWQESQPVLCFLFFINTTTPTWKRIQNKSSTFCQKQLLFRTISWQVIKHAYWSRPPRCKRTAEMKLTLALAETQARLTNPSHALHQCRACWKDLILRPTILFSWMLGPGVIITEFSCVRFAWLSDSPFPSFQPHASLPEGLHSAVMLSTSCSSKTPRPSSSSGNCLFYNKFQSQNWFK